MTRRSYMLALVLGAFAAGCGDKNPLSVDSGEAVRMLVLDGDSQQGVMGQATAVAPSVLVIDANNLPVGGVVVNFSILAGGGTLSSAQSTTGSDGSAKVTWTLGNGFGLKTLRATSADLGSVTFEAHAIAPDAGLASFTQTDPTGDTLAFVDPSWPLGHDLVSLKGDFKRDSVIFTFTFASPVLPMSSGASNSVGGLVEIDIDDDQTTGEFPFANAFGATASIGVEYVISLFETTPTSATFFSLDDFAEVPATFVGNVVTVRVPMSLLGMDDGNYSLVGIVGTADRPTDFVPNTGSVRARTASAPARALESQASQRSHPTPRHQIPAGIWGKRPFATSR